jgi:hypothetical protein
MVTPVFIFGVIEEIFDDCSRLFEHLRILMMLKLFQLQVVPFRYDDFKEWVVPVG